MENKVKVGCVNCILNIVFEAPLILESLMELQNDLTKCATSYCACSRTCRELVYPSLQKSARGSNPGVKCSSSNCKDMMYISNNCFHNKEKKICCYCFLQPSEDVDNWFFGSTDSRRASNYLLAQSITQSLKPADNNSDTIMQTRPSSPYVSGSIIEIDHVDDEHSEIDAVQVKAPVMDVKFNYCLTYEQIKSLLSNQDFTAGEMYTNDSVMNYMSNIANDYINQKNVVLLRNKQDPIRTYYFDSFLITQLCFDFFNDDIADQHKQKKKGVVRNNENHFNYLRVGATFFPLYPHCFLFPSLTSSQQLLTSLSLSCSISSK